MGGGTDLNAKKSWHTSNLSNQKKVWAAEQAALAERKKTAERLEEIRKEKAEEEIKRQLEISGARKRIDRVDWMYQGPSNENGLDEHASEAYLLGKSRIDRLLTKNDETKKLEKSSGQEHFMPAQTVNNARDMATKIRDDPLLAIKQNEQNALQAAMNDPAKRRQLLASMGLADEQPKEKKDKHRKHRHHHRRRHRDDDSDDERRHRRRRSTSRDRSPARRRYDSEGEDRSKRKRRDSRDRRRDHSRDRRRDQSRDRRRSRSRSSTPKKERTEDDRRSRYRERSRSRSSSPRPRRDERQDSYRRRDDDRARPRYDDRRNGNGSRQNGGWRANGNNGDKPRRDEKADEEERARKLAAMQTAASDLDIDRERRLAELEAREKQEREADDKARQRDSKFGGRTFTNGLHQKASDISLADRIGRGRRGMQKVED